MRALFCAFTCLVVGVTAFVAAPSPVPGDAETGIPAMSPPVVHDLAGRRPNIVWITADDMRADDLRYMPRTNRLMQGKGVSFVNAISPFPLCCPARASLLTGQYAHNHQVLDNDYPRGGHRRFYELGLDEETVAVWLRRAGYHTTFIGKYLNFYGAETGRQASPGRRYVPPGWDDWNATVGETLKYFCARMNRDGDFRRFRGRYQTDLFTELARRRIHRLATEPSPFFMWISHLAPHHGMAPDSLREPCGSVHGGVPSAPRHRGMFTHKHLPPAPSRNERSVADKGLYMQAGRLLTHEDLQQIKDGYRGRLRSLQALDQSVAEILRQLRTQRILDETVVVFVSDNGWLLGEHRLKGKILPYEESLRVPLLVRGPGFRAGAVRRQPVSIIDIPATAVALARAGRDVGTVLDGVSLTDLAFDRHYLTKRILPIESGPKPRWQKPLGPLPDYFYRGAWTRRYTYIDWQFADDRVDEEFYDRQSDPFQRRSADHMPSRELTTLRRLSAGLEDCSGIECVVTMPDR